VALACAPGTVRVGFHPVVGTELSYRIVVRTTSLLSVDGQAPRSKQDQVVLRAKQTVLATDASGSTVRVVLEDAGGSQRVVEVKLDRGAQLVGVDAKDRASMGDLGVAEIFPAAAGAPPDRALRPGERWHIDSPVTLPQATPSRLVGDGRLIRLGRARGRSTATVRTTSELPVVRRTEGSEGKEAVLEGTQRTTTTTTHAIADGAVESSRSVTAATYSLRLLPPPGVEGDPVNGTLDLEVRSETVRV
jgi:hypothetical protein